MLIIIIIIINHHHYHHHHIRLLSNRQNAVVQRDMRVEEITYS